LIFAQISRNIHKSCFLRKYPGIFTRKSIDFRVTILENKLISGYCYSEINWLPGNNSWKSIYKLISGYCYSEINWLPGNNSWKSIDFRVLCPGNRYEKNLILWISPRKQKYLWKYFSMWTQGPGTIYSWKKPEVEKLMLQSL